MELCVSVKPMIATADGNPNGSIRFGSTNSTNYIVAMHEISRTLRIGDNNWDGMMVNGISLLATLGVTAFLASFHDR